MPLPALAPGHRGREGRGGGSGDEFGRDGVGVWVGTRVAQGSPGTTSWALRARLILCIAVLKFLSFRTSEVAGGGLGGLEVDGTELWGP